MNSGMEAALQTHLLERRQGLQAAISEFKDAGQLVNLLKEVDSALERIDRGSYGICQVCNDSIEEETLLEDPLVRMCLSHLSQEQQRAIERDLELASQVQNTLLPKRDLVTAGWQIRYHYEAAGIVSGDYCDIMASGENGDLYFLVGDISGKGVAASLLMSHLHAIFRSLVALDLPIDKLVERANVLFCDRSFAGRFATLVCGKAHASGTVHLCSAGHCPPIVASSSQMLDVEATGLPIGLFSSSKYSMKEIQMKHGDTILLYTDGVSEARNDSDRDYGTNSLRETLHNYHTLQPGELLGRCVKDLTTFRGNAPLFDDVTMMVIRRL